MPEALPTIPGGQGHVLNGAAVASPTTWSAGGQLRVGPPQFTVTLGGGRLTLSAGSLVTLTVDSGNLCFQIDDGSGAYTGSEEVASGSTMSVDGESELGFEDVESLGESSGEGGLDRDFGKQNQQEGDDDGSDGFQTSTIKYRLRSIRVRTGAKKTPTSQPSGTVNFSYRASTGTYSVSSTGIGFELYVDGSPTTTNTPGQSLSGRG